MSCICPGYTSQEAIEERVEETFQSDDPFFTYNNTTDRIDAIIECVLSSFGWNNKIKWYNPLTWLVAILISPLRRSRVQTIVNDVADRILRNAPGMLEGPTTNSPSRPVSIPISVGSNLEQEELLDRPISLINSCLMSGINMGLGVGAFLKRNIISLSQVRNFFPITIFANKHIAKPTKSQLGLKRESVESKQQDKKKIPFIRIFNAFQAATKTETDYSEELGAFVAMRMLPKNASAFNIEDKTGKFTITYKEAQTVNINEVGENGLELFEGASLSTPQTVTGKLDYENHAIEFDKDQLVVNGLQGAVGVALNGAKASLSKIENVSVEETDDNGNTVTKNKIKLTVKGKIFMKEITRRPIIDMDELRDTFQAAGWSRKESSKI